MVIHLVINCSECDATITALYWRSRDAALDLIATAKAKGWQIKGKYDPAICPECVRLNAAAKPEPELAERTGGLQQGDVLLSKKLVISPDRELAERTAAFEVP